MVTQANCNILPSFHNCVVMTFLVALKTNEFDFICILAMPKLLSLETQKWVWGENIHIHTKVSNFQIKQEKAC